MKVDLIRFADVLYTMCGRRKGVEASSREVLDPLVGEGCHILRWKRLERSSFKGKIIRSSVLIRFCLRYSSRDVYNKQWDVDFKEEVCADEKKFGSIYCIDWAQSYVSERDHQRNTYIEKRSQDCTLGLPEQIE